MQSFGSTSQWCVKIPEGSSFPRSGSLSNPLPYSNNIQRSWLQRHHYSWQSWFQATAPFSKGCWGPHHWFPQLERWEPRDKVQRGANREAAVQLLLPSFSTSLPERLQKTAGNSEKGNKKRLKDLWDSFLGKIKRNSFANWLSGNWITA